MFTRFTRPWFFDYNYSIAFPFRFFKPFKTSSHCNRIQQDSHYQLESLRNYTIDVLKGHSHANFFHKKKNNSYLQIKNFGSVKLAANVLKQAKIANKPKNHHHKIDNHVRE